MPTNRPPLLLFAALVGFLAADPTFAQSVEKVRPAEPVRGAVVGPKPLLKIAVEGHDIPKMKFRIMLSRDDFETTPFVFDGQKSDDGWAFIMEGDYQGACYRVRDPLPDGVWQWKVSAWNGIEWVDGKEIAKLTIDAVPPAEVDGIVMHVDRQNKAIELSWVPVLTDSEGKGEHVAKYRVYRYERKSFFTPIRYFQIGETELTFFVDKSRVAWNAPMMFYRIAAEDTAGNEVGKRY